jgi:integrase
MRSRKVNVMPGKVPQPWYRQGRGWFVWINGKQHPLGQDEREANRRFHLLMAGADPTPQARPKAEPKPESQAGPTVAALADAYLADAGRRLSANPLRVAKWMVNTFATLYGTLPAEAVRKHHVETWVRKHPRWGPSTENLAKTRIGAMYRWAVEQGFLTSNPVQGMRKPPIKSRGRQALIPQADHERLMAEAFPALRDVLFALRESGARPGEVTSVTAAEFDADAGVWVLSKHKTAEKGQQRIVYLTPGLVALCKTLAAKHPTGPLLRNAHGKPWHKVGVAKRVRELRVRLGIKGRVTAYGYRHSFATDALANGVPDAQVAELLGHQGTAMLHRHYAHLGARARALKDALGKVR